MAKKTIKYLENGEYHDATVKDVGVIEELKTESKDNLVEAINEIFLGGGKGFSDLQQKVDESTQAAQNAQQAANNLQQRLEEVANSGLSDEEARKIINQAVEDAKRAQAEALQAYKDAQKELDDSMAQFMEEQKAINKELEQAKADIQGDIDQKNAEIEQINTVIESTKSDLTATSARLASVRNDLTNAQMDWGKVRTEITNINGKLDSKMSNTDFDEYKERIERNETEVTQTKNELQSKATKQDLDVLTGTVTTQGSSITQLAGKIEQKVSKDTLANDIDDFQVKKANIFTGTREFMGWEFSDKALGRVNDDIYNHAKVAELHNGSNLSITVDGLEVGKTYSVSIFAKASANSNTSGVKVTVDNGKSYSGLMRTVYTPHDTKVTTNWQRYYATIVASATTMKFVFDRSGITSDITLYLNRPKLEVGETVYAWEDNAQDIYKRVEHTEAQFDVYNDQISGIVKRQTETDKKIENVSSTFTQRADGIEANAKKYTNDKVTGLTEEFSGRLKATSQELSTEYEKQTNAKIGALSDGGSNLILNSSFLVTDNNGNATLENWRDTSSKISLTKPNGLDGTWIKVNRATTGTALGARSNYFPVKQGKLVVGVDVALDGTGNISPYVLRIEYYDVSNNRVNYEDITLQKLGLSASQITKSGSNFRYARGVYKTSNDRSDVAKACIVVPETITGYDMYLTNFFAKFSDVNDGTYEVNPLDQQASLIKQRTKIEQDSEKINLLNTQTEKLGNDIKATNTSVNVLKGEVDLKASQSTVNDLTNRVAKNAADIKVFPDKIKSEVSEVSKKIDGVNDKVDNIKVGGTNLIPHSEVDTIRGDTDYWVFSTGNINNYGGRYNPTDKSLELEAHIKDTNYQFLQWQQQNNVLMNTELAHLQVGDVLTVSAEVYIQNPNMSGNITLGFRVNPRTNYNSYFSTERGIDLRNLKTGWQRVSATGTITQKYLDCMNDVQLMRILLAANGLKENNKIAFRKIKVEKGNIATDWSPATEDTDASIESVKTVATQTKDGFDRLTQKTGYNASTGEFSKITTQINEGIKGVSTQVSSVSNRLDNLSVGGTNLLRNTRFSDGSNWGYTGTAHMGAQNTNKPSGVPSDNQTMDIMSTTANSQNALVQTPKVKAGETYTVSFWGKADKETYMQVESNQNTRFNQKIGTSWQKYSGQVIFQTDNRTLYIYPTTANVWVHINSLKLEKGNIATDWSPAPEDLQEGIDIATTKATQTNTKFEHMISQIQYNASTGEIGKYEHKITELANGTQEKISAIRTDSDKKLQSATQTLTNKIGDLEKTIRTNTTNIGQYRQEMTNSAKEWSTKFTSVQTDMSSVSNRLDNLSQANLYYNSEFTYTGNDPHNIDGIRSTSNVAYSKNGRWANYKGSNSVFASTRGGLNDYYWIEQEKDKYINVNPGEIVSASVVTWVTGGSDVPKDGYAICAISFYKDLTSNRLSYKEVSVAAKDINFPNFRTLKVENVTVPDGANYMALQLIIRGSSNWQFSQPMLVKSDKVGAYAPSTQLQLNQVADKTDSNTDKIEVLSGKITANSNEFSTVYSKITNVQNVVNSDGGGINLAKHTSNKLSNVTASPWLFVGSPSSSSFNNLQDYQGKYMTIRVWIEKPSRDARVRIWTDKWAIEGNTVKAGQSGYSTASGVIPTGFSAWNIPIGSSQGEVSFGWKEFKIELGNVATPWSPNPDDVDNNIDTAANNARTNAKNDAINAIKSDSQWQSMGKIVTNASFLQNSDGFAQEVSKRIVGSTGQTNLYYNSEFTYTGTDPHNMDGIQSTRNVAYSRNDRWSSYKGSNAVFASTRGTLNNYYYIEHKKDKYVKVQPGEVVSASVVTWVTGSNDVPKDGYAICAISFYKDLKSNRLSYEEVSVAAKDINFPNFRTLKVENVTVPDGANYMALQLIIRGSSNWQFSQPMLVKDDHVGVYVPSTQLQLNDISSRTQFLQDDKQFLLRVQQVGGATQADVNSANSKISGLTDRVKSTEVAITSGGVTINGNTKIDGELSANVFTVASQDERRGKPAFTIKSDGFTIGNQQRDTEDGTWWRYNFNKDGIKIISDNDRSDKSLKYGGQETQGYIGNGFANADKAIQSYGRLNTGIEIGLTPFEGFLGREPQSSDPEIYGGDYIGIGEYKQNTKRIYNRDFKPGYLYIPYDIPEWVTNGNDPFFEEKYLRRGNGDKFKRGNNLIGNTQFYPTDAENSIRITWVAWSDWGNRKMPAIVNGNDNYGGITFPNDGNVAMFNCKGMRFNMYAQDNQKYRSWGTWSNAAWGDIG